MTEPNTPYYIIEERLLRSNLSLIKSVAERSGVEIILAFKAFALWKTFPIFREYINQTTASSVYEARLAFEQFGSPAHTYSPAYEDDTFAEILRCSSHITFNSIIQLEHFIPKVGDWNSISDRVGDHQVISCGLRINPEHSHIETDLYNPTAPGTRFGVTADDLSKHEDILDKIDGFHCHCHCESSAEDFADNLIYIKKNFGKWFSRIKWLNLGGGHLMTRKEYNVELLIKTLQDLRAEYPHLHITLEPGSAFAWQTGPLVSSVVDIVENHGIRTAILNVSFTCHMPDCLEMPYWPKVCGAETIEDEKGVVSSKDDIKNQEGHTIGFCYRLGGNSCLSGDFMSSWIFDHELQIGEKIILEDMNHYTTVKTCMFNGIHHPSIAIRRMDDSVEILRQYQYEDYLNRMD